MNILTKIGASVSALALSCTMATAQEYTLTISSWAPPTHGINAIMWPQLIEMIEEATDGRVTAELRLGLAPPPAQMDMVQDGAADMSIIFHGYQAGRFTATKMIELPGYEGSAEAASVAYWAVHEEYLAAADEHRGVKLIALMTHGPAQLHSNQDITGLESFDGMKVRIPGGVGGDVGAALGVVGIQVPAPKVYETLASNAADGVVMPYESRQGFRLTEVATNVYEMPGGLYRGSFALIMNEDAFADLPEDLQTALEEEVFGAPASRMAGIMWDDIDAEGRTVPAETECNMVIEDSAEYLAAFEAIAAEVRATVMAEVDAAGVDAQAAYEMIQAVMAEN